MPSKLAAIAAAITAFILSVGIASCETAASTAQSGYCVAQAEFENAHQRTSQLASQSAEIVDGVAQGQFVILPGNNLLQVLIVTPAVGSCADARRPAIGRRITPVSFDRADLEARTHSILVSRPDPRARRACVFRIDQIGELSLDVRTIVGQVGLSRIAMFHSNTSLLIGTDDSCELALPFVTQALGVMRGDVNVHVETCPNSSLSECGA